MLTEKEIELNRIKFIDLMSTVKRDGANVDGFLKWLMKSDFFTAPASAKYHCNYAGGLCEHSLNVYNNLLKLTETIAPKTYSDDTLKIVALLHDLSKVNYYEQYYRNTKDDSGNWVKVPEYKTKDDTERFIFGSHEQTSEYMARTFFPLTPEECTAILHHHGGKGNDSAQDNIHYPYYYIWQIWYLHL